MLNLRCQKIEIGVKLNLNLFQTYLMNMDEPISSISFVARNMNIFENSISPPLLRLCRKTTRTRSPSFSRLTCLQNSCANTSKTHLAHAKFGAHQTPKYRHTRVHVSNKVFDLISLRARKRGARVSRMSPYLWTRAFACVVCPV